MRARELATTAARKAAPGLAGLMALVDRPAPGRLAVLMYHRIGHDGGDPALDPSLLSATPEGFAHQIAFLAANRPIISADTLLAVRRGEAELPPGAVMITFDDAYADFAEHAWPVLRACSAPVTLFVPTAFPDRVTGGFWWDRLHAAFRATDRRDPLPTGAGPLPLESVAQRSAGFAALRDWIKTLPHDDAMAAVDAATAGLGGAPDVHRVLGWDELRRLASEGVTLAPHTRTHPLMNRLPLARAIDEARGSWEDLERNIGPTPKILAYPAGGYAPAVVGALADEGFEAAFTTRRGSNEIGGTPWLELARRNVGARSSLDVLRLQLMTPFARPRPAR